jgi:hypothetical protein
VEIHDQTGLATRVEAVRHGPHLVNTLPF